MSYLLDKKIKRNKFFKYAIFAVILFFLIYFRTGIFYGLSYIAHTVFKPVLVLGNNFGEKLSNTGSYFYSKNSLFLENKDLKSKLNEQEARIANYNSILDENLKIKEMLGRSAEGKTMILGTILFKPNQSAYDTLVIDVGEREGVQNGNMVFAKGDVPIGRVDTVYPASSRVILFSSPGEKTEVIISDIFSQITGRGGGNFEMNIPRDFILEKGVEVVLSGIRPSAVARVETILSDPRDPFQKALLVSPVNIQELKFVQIEL